MLETSYFDLRSVTGEEAEGFKDDIVNGLFTKMSLKLLLRFDPDFIKRSNVNNNSDFYCFENCECNFQ